MMGGYLTFMGIEAKGQWRNTPVEQALPVTMLPCDDRREHPEGIHAVLCARDDAITHACRRSSRRCSAIMQLTAKAQAKVLIHYESDPILTVWEYGKGRSFAWAKRLRAALDAGRILPIRLQPHTLEQCPSLGSEADLRRIQGGYQL